MHFMLNKQHGKTILLQFCKLTRKRRIRISLQKGEGLLNEKPITFKLNSNSQFFKISTLWLPIPETLDLKSKTKKFDLNERVFMAIVFQGHREQYELAKECLKQAISCSKHHFTFVMLAKVYLMEGK